jgi:two-component system, LuxR family, sensor kinase FixL
MNDSAPSQNLPLAPTVPPLQWETLLLELSATFVDLPADQIDSEIESALGQIVEALGIERSGFGEMSADQSKFVITHSYEVPGVPPSPRMIVDEQMPWFAQKIRHGDALRLARLPDDLPAEAAAERAYCSQSGLKSHLTIPLKERGLVVAGIGFNSFHSYRDWPDELIQRLRLVGEVFTHALARKRAHEKLCDAFAALSETGEELRTQHAQLASIYHTAPVGLAFVDAALRYVTINDYLAAWNGRPAEAHVGQTVGQVLPADLTRMIEPIYRQVIATGRPVVDVEVKRTTSSGTERSWLASHYPVKNLQGRVLGVSTVVQEISERKQLQQATRELVHASRLAVAGELTASIAHEINQPLGAILSNVDAAEMLLSSSTASLDEVRQILDEIRRDDLRASEVIRRLRMLLCKREMEIQPVDLNLVVTEVVWLTRVESDHRGVELKTELAGDLPAVRGDKVHLQQVFLNLFLNALDAMADTRERKQLTVRTVCKGDAVIEVSDTGPGILPEQLPRIFDPFFSTKKDGMGIGLSLTRSLVESHGGRIWAENNPGGGASFRFTLPTDRDRARA